VLIDEVLQEKLRREVLPRDLGHTSREGVAVPPGSPFTLYSTATNAWTNRAGYPFAALTLHYLMDDFAIKSHVLAVRHFPAPHTAAAYEELLSGLLEENGLLEGNLRTCARRQTAAPRQLVLVRVTREGSPTQLFGSGILYIYRGGKQEELSAKALEKLEKLFVDEEE
jgi:hypothetical protein